MKRGNYIVFWFYFFLIILSGCEEKINWELDKNTAIEIIVDGILTNESKQQKIKLSKPVAVLNEKSQPVSGAEVTVFDGMRYYSFFEMDTVKGTYMSDTSFIPSSGKEYLLTILYNKKIFSARSNMVPVTPFSPVQYLTVSGKNNIFEIVPDFKSEEPAIFEFFLQYPQTDGSGKKFVLMYYYVLKTADISQFFTPQKEKIEFPAYTKIIEKKYSLTHDHAEYIRSILAETEWRGSFFDVLPANSATNLSEGASGFFGLCTVISDTIIVLP